MSGTFDVIPALDLRGGRLARMPRGDPAAVVALPGDPVVLAAAHVADGASWIHVVDLDAALSGRAANLNLLGRIAALPVRVQAGGGLSREGVGKALERGASRAVLGAAALSDPETLARTVAQHGDRVGVALDVRDGVVAPRGSFRRGPPLEDALALLAEVRPAFLVYTETASDGAWTGPNLPALERVSAAVGVPILASGGVRSVEDLRALTRLAPRVAGVVVGRALHEGRFGLREAIHAVAATRGAGVGQSASGPSSGGVSRGSFRTPPRR